MIFTTPMKQLIAVVLENDLDAVTRSLLNIGVMHFVEVTKLHGEEPGLSRIEQKINSAEIEESRKRIETILSYAEIKPEGEFDIGHLEALDIQSVRQKIDKLAGELQNLRDRQSTIQQEVLRLEEIGKQVELLGDVRNGLENQSQFSYL